MFMCLCVLVYIEWHGAAVIYGAMMFMGIFKRIYGVYKLSNHISK